MTTLIPKYDVGGTGSVNRPINLKLAEFVSVQDFGAVGDGSTDDTTSIQNAATYANSNGRALYFPTPSSFYKIISPIVVDSVQAGCHWIGEVGDATIIRNTSGSGSVLNCTGTTSAQGPYLIENLRIGGIGCTGLQITGGGYASYVSGLTMRNCHFEADLLYGMNADFIYLDLNDCTFGFYKQTSVNVAWIPFKASGSGASLQTNVNRITRCNFYYAPAGSAIQLTNGVLWRLSDCDISYNYTALTASDLQGLILDNCYSEGSTATSGSIFTFAATSTTTRVIGGVYVSGSTGTYSMFGASGNTGPLLVENAQIAVNATGASIYVDTDFGYHYTPSSGVHNFKDCNMTAGAGDAVGVLSAIIEGGVYTYTPTVTGMTVVNNSGLPTYTGYYSVKNRQVIVTIQIDPPGATTVQSVLGTTYFTMPPFCTGATPNKPGTCVAVNNQPALYNSYAAGFVATTGKIYSPSWAAQNGELILTATYTY